jgi:hypothetical protein
MRDTLLDFIEKSEKRNEEDGGLVNFCAAIFWKMFFLLFSIACLGSLGAGAAYLVRQFITQYY